MSSYLKSQNTVAIAQIDTRALTMHLRESGAQNGAILALNEDEAMTSDHLKHVVALAQQAPAMSGADLARIVSTSKSYQWRQKEWSLEQGYLDLSVAKYRVVALDFGVKRNILRMLATRGCEVIVLPAQSSFEEILSHQPDGVFLSNGPGDPEPCTYAIEATRALLAKKIPIFGICLGHQILALASGARTFKMKFGHHGANHPVKDLLNGRVSITSQNHGFAVDLEQLPQHLTATHISLFDGTLQGLAHVAAPAFGFQGHPEASPGPHDIGYLFDQFIGMMETQKNA